MIDYRLPAAEAEPPAEQASSFDPAEYLGLLLRRWPLIAALAALGLTLGLARYFTTPSLYRATATLQIEQPTVFSVGGTVNPWLETWAGMKYYPTQYRLLESRGLAERTVDRLGLASDERFHDEAAPSRLAEMSEQERDALRARLANRLLADLGVAPIKGTELVELSFISADPELAALIANGLATAYIEKGIEERQQNVYSASSFIEQQIEEVKAEIDTKDRALREEGRSVDIVTLDPQSNDLLERINQLNQSYTQAIADRVEAESRYRELRSTSARAVVEANPTPRTEEARRALSVLRREYESKLAVYKEDHPVMLNLDSRIGEEVRNLEAVIGSEAESQRRKAFADYQTALRREGSLKAQLDRARDEAIALNSVAVNLKNLEMEISTRRELLDNLLRQQSETGISASLQRRGHSNVHLIDRALAPAAPFRPSLSTDAITGTGGGLILGIGLVLLLHFLDRTIKTPEELERTLGLPVLAVIPDLSTNTKGKRYAYASGKRRSRRRSSQPPGDEAPAIELVPMTRPRIGVSEAYRSLRTALLLSTPGGIHVISVTSAQSSEGKTVTALNLATVLAQLGRSTLLVDADLRKPRLHQVVGVSNRVGLVNALTEGADIGGILHPTPVENLTLCPSGPHPPNPSELLASERMSDFIAAARARFDLVVIDTPPVMAVTDAILVGKLSQGTVLVFRAGKVQRDDVRTCHSRLRMAEVRVLGALLNCYNPTMSGSYDRRYYYYYSTYEEYAGGEGGSAADSAA